MIRKRIEELLQAINIGIYEKETELSLSLLAALAGESVILRPSRCGQINGCTKTETGIRWCK